MTKKEMAKDFLMLTSKGKARDAFELYVSEKFRHHNAYFKGDRHTLMAAMDENDILNPDKTFEIQRAVEEGDLVAIHSRVELDVGDKVFAVMHIFKFEYDKIVELWDFGQAVPADMINENGMF